jgi:hypothetical protein
LPTPSIHQPVRAVRNQEIPPEEAGAQDSAPAGLGTGLGTEAVLLCFKYLKLKVNMKHNEVKKYFVKSPQSAKNHINELGLRFVISRWSAFYTHGSF